MQFLALKLYGLLIWLASPLLRAKLRRRARREPGYALQVDERFGHYETAVCTAAAAQAGPLVWLHAVSLGETRAAALLLAELRQQLPAMRLLLTHGTATGRAAGQALLQPGDLQVWLPWDTAGATRRFVRQLRPAIGVLMETEVWPNLAAACRAAGVPLVLANARLNAKSYAGARRLSWLARPAYAGLRAVWAQTEADAARLADVGAPVAAVLGNLKFDVQPSAAQHAQGRSWRARAGRPVILLASTREGEEALWLQVLQSNQAQTLAGQALTAIKNEVAKRGQTALPPVQWLLVPRHPQRFDEVEQLCRAAGLRVARRSQWTGDPAPADVWLGDSLGEMALYAGMAHAALLGGSFAPLGGQNLIELAASGCPVVMGPHTFNFAQAAELALAAGAAQRVPDMAAGVQAACALVADAALQQRRCADSLAFAAAHRGAARATAQAIADVLHAR
ncbi:3-deoxy-D-manno-octulosonic acid transferase [Melaminivora jejuensis]|uniref:3-deoxy-D-manno-octulosonic acid transferase n=1 Tax=Melaminivora jejuensis TaxID=1267217 RepID=UPI001ADF964B|nr:3-deoxy-D-manno-octulosonic acid transferase [Melaminivora jejuensis]UHJ63639.1 3-deoxy-D-manno-octulosonic acid transferase [Melaminivora jejuensis]